MAGSLLRLGVPAADLASWIVESPLSTDGLPIMEALGDDGEELWIRAVVLSSDGMLAVRNSLSGKPADAEAIGRQLATEMLEDGADQL